MPAPFDLHEPRFTQTQVLAMLPDLKAKTLQNWSNRGILDTVDQKPGKGVSRRYSPLGVVMLNFMSGLLPFGIPPQEARDMADHVAEAAIEFFERDPEIITREDGARWIPVRADNIAQFRRATIIPMLDGSYWLRFLGDENSFEERMRSRTVLLVEIDFDIAQAINRIFLLEAGSL